MPSLLDRPSEDGLRLLQIVADGFAANDDDWPVWQYVMHRLDTANADPEETLQNLPTWQHHYRPVSNEWSGIPEPDTQIALTVHGMYHADRPATNRLVEVFLTTLRLAVAQQRGMTPQPGRAVTVASDAQQLMAAVKSQLGPVWVTPPQLGSLLRREPATRPGITGSQDAWTWDLTRLRLQRFRDVTTPEGYLTKLDQIVGIPAVPTIGQVQLPPLALLEAFDHLDLAWRLVTGKRLVRVRCAPDAGRLTQPAASGDEFSSRCSALTDLLNLFDLPGDKNTKSLQRLKAHLEELLDDQAGRALAAVDMLRQVVAVRAGQQHTGGDAAKRAAQAHVALGLASYVSDWAAAWEQVRAVTLGALTTIREEVTRLIPA